MKIFVAKLVQGSHLAVENEAWSTLCTVWLARERLSWLQHWWLVTTEIVEVQGQQPGVTGTTWGHSSHPLQLNSWLLIWTDHPLPPDLDRSIFWIPLDKFSVSHGCQQLQGGSPWGGWEGEGHCSVNSLISSRLCRQNINGSSLRREQVWGQALEYPAGENQINRCDRHL